MRLLESPHIKTSSFTLEKRAFIYGSLNFASNPAMAAKSLAILGCMQYLSERLLATKTGQLTDDQLKGMHTWNGSNLDGWVTRLTSRAISGIRSSECVRDRGSKFRTMSALA